MRCSSVPTPTLPERQFETLARLSDFEVAELLRSAIDDAQDVPYREGFGELRVSLPGAQPKTALRLTDDGWHLPTGSLATTHILKPQRGHLNPVMRDSIAVNEHLCQAAASTLGLDAARTSLEVFEDEICMVAERFDRHTDGSDVQRHHFEDLCQTFGHAPGRKYQSDGGATPEAVIALLRHETAHNEARKFFLSVYYNWLIGNADGHSKNYGLILDSAHHRLAPLYDLSSTAIYPELGVRARTPAMRFYGPEPTTPQQWASIAAQLNIDVAADELETIAEALPEAFETAAQRCPQWAAQTAEIVSGRVAAHTRTVIRDTHGWVASMVSSQTGTPLKGVETEIKTCGETVRQTGLPCLLSDGHKGRHRSVL